jgi:hypothetical protein
VVGVFRFKSHSSTQSILVRVQQLVFQGLGQLVLVCAYIANRLVRKASICNGSLSSSVACSTEDEKMFFLLKISRKK